VPRGIYRGWHYPSIWRASWARARSSYPPPRPSPTRGEGEKEQALPHKGEGRKRPPSSTRGEGEKGQPSPTRGGEKGQPSSTRGREKKDQLSLRLMSMYAGQPPHEKIGVYIASERLKSRLKPSAGVPKFSWGANVQQSGVFSGEILAGSRFSA